MFIHYRGWQKVFCPKASGATMARRRMISNKITGSYNFQSMEPKTQLLYFYCCLSADDDGFVGNPYIYTILTGCSENDLETLEQRGFVILFDPPCGQ